MIELKKKPVCCGKDMLHSVNGQNMLSPTTDTQGWTCLTCGHYITILDGKMDEEELDSVRPK